MAAPIQLTNAIGAGTVKLKQCSIADAMVPGTFKVLKNKDTASPTIVAFGQLQQPFGISDAVWPTLNQNVAMKCSFPNHNYTKYFENYGLAAEIAMYKAVAELIRRNYTPNIVLYVDSWRCPLSNFVDGIPESARKQFMKQYMELLLDDERGTLTISKNPEKTKLWDEASILSQEYGKLTTQLNNNRFTMSPTEIQDLEGRIDESRTKWKAAQAAHNDLEAKLELEAGMAYMKTDVVDVLLTEQSQGKSLRQAIAEQKLSESEVFALLFQLIFTLHVFSVIGIRQSDLHTGNVFVDQYMPPAAQFAYVLDPAQQGKSTYYLVPATHIVKIYDFDFGGIYDPILGFPKIMNEQMVLNRGCSAQSACGRNAKADMFRVLAFLWRQMVDNQSYPKVRQFIEKVVNINLLEQRKIMDLCVWKNHKLLVDQAQCPPKTKVDMGLTYCSLDHPEGWVAPDCWVLSPLESLSLPEFDQWRKAFNGKALDTPYVYGLWPDQGVRQRFIQGDQASSWVDSIAQKMLSYVIE